MNSKSKPLAFGVEPARSRYYLRLARYHALAEDVAAYVSGAAPSMGRKLQLLDVGVGRGRSMRYLDARGVSDQVDYFGVDNSDHRLQSLIYARERWQLTKADVEEGLPYQDNQFDIVVCEQLLEHLSRPGFVREEISRVLRPGGLLVLGVPTFPPVIAHVRRLLVWALYRFFGIVREHRQTFTAWSMRALVTGGNSLEIVQARGFRIFSGGPLRIFERYSWWYRLNRWLGALVPSLCTEIQVIARRVASSQ